MGVENVLQNSRNRLSSKLASRYICSHKLRILIRKLEAKQKKMDLGFWPEISEPCPIDFKISFWRYSRKKIMNLNSEVKRPKILTQNLENEFLNLLWKEYKISVWGRGFRMTQIMILKSELIVLRSWPGILEPGRTD